MNTRDFLDRVLGDSGHYCVFGARAGSSSKTQKFYKTIDQVLETALALDGNESDAYFALATFESPRDRKANNAKVFRSFYMDIDCGEGHSYLTKGEALGAVKKFTQSLHLPKPIVVDSGNGIHLYWPLTESISARDWAPVAKALKKACTDKGLRADPAVTADVSRILRVPGTHNYKADPPKPVSIVTFGDVESVAFADFADLLDGYSEGITEPLFESNSLMGTLDPSMSKFLGGKEFYFKNIALKLRAGKGCEQLKFIIEQQSDVDEPLWRAGLSIAKACMDSEKSAVLMSKMHPDYSYENTMAKMEATIAPHTCDTFNNLRPGVCGECPLRGKIKSPISLGGQVAEANEEDNVVEANSAETGDLKTYVIPQLPKPYVRSRTGGVYLQTRDDDGDLQEVCVYENDLYFTGRVYDKDEGESLVARLHLPRDGVREFTLTLGQVTSPDELRKALSSRGVVANHKKAWESIMVYANSWVSHLQAECVADTAHRQFGWTDDNTTEVFVLGSKEIHGDREEFNPPTSATAGLMPAFTTQGTLEGWKAQANFFNRDGMEPFQFMMCLGLAAPLMAMTPYNAAMFTLYSDGSGHGKTTAQKIALAAFGNPGMLIMEATDTVNFRMGRMEVLKNIPAQWDEVTNIEAKAVSDLLYQIQTGKQRGRMSSGSNAERITGEPWKTTCGFTSNESLLSKVRNKKGAPEGEVYRLLEHHAQAHNFAAKSETDKLSEEVGRHYGHVGVPWIQYIINNRDEVRQIIKAVQRQIDDTAGLVAKDRFWSVTAAVAVTAAIIGKKTGFLNYDPLKLRDWSIELIKANKREQLESVAGIETQITNYISEHYGDILWIKSTEDRRGAASSGDGLDSLVVPEQQPRGKFIARFETDTKILALLPKPFQAWCASQHLNYDSVVKDLLENMNGERKRVRLYKGTKFNLPATQAIVIDCKDLDMEDITDGSSDS